VTAPRSQGLPREPRSGFRAQLKTRKSVHRVRVAYADTDAAQVVHHASYFRYLEVARVEYWREHGFDYAQFEKDTGLGLPVVEARLRYRAIARFDEVLDVETWVARASRASVWFDAVMRKGGAVIHESSVRLACASFKDGTIRRIPDALLDACLEQGHGI
jgi:acyl-CoA thioester hydrolase